jgi:SAM-dependent methyltransferase
MKKKYYWDKYYKKIEFSNIKPSTFSKFCYNNFIKKSKKKRILDIGCGNGRDSFFFLKKGLKVIGIDKSSVAIKINKNKFPNEKNLLFYKKNINKFNFKNLGKFDFIYLRFLLHAINSETQKNLFKHILNVKKKGSLIMLEFRTDKDSLMNKGKKISKNETFTDHYRRFLNVKDVLKNFKILPFKLIYILEKKGLSKYKNDNAVLCRLILKVN